MKSVQRWTQSFDSIENEDDKQSSGFKISNAASHRPAKFAQGRSPATIDRVTVIEFPPHKRQKEAVMSGSVTVKVTRIPRKGNHLLRRMPAKQERTPENDYIMMSTRGADYKESCSSPHIKPRYMQRRYRNKVLSSGAQTTGEDIIVPQVQGVAMTPIMSPLIQPNTISTQGEDVCVQNPRSLQPQKFRPERSINSDIQEVELQPLYEPMQSLPHPKPPNFMARGYQAKRLCRPTTQPHISAQQSSNDTMGYKIDDDDLETHRLQVTMTDGQRSLIENDGISTVRDGSSSPTRILLQLSSHQSSDMPARQKLKRKSEQIQSNGQWGKHSSHVQLTDYFINKKKAQWNKMNTQMPEHMLLQPTEQPFSTQHIAAVTEQQSHQNSQDLTHVISQDDGTQTGKVTDYNTACPSILLPKLNNGPGGFVNQKDGHATLQNGGSGQEFNVHNSATRSQAELPSENLHKWSQSLQPSEHPSNVLSSCRQRDRMYGKHARVQMRSDKILIHQGEYQTDLNFNVSSHDSAASLQSNTSLRTKSMLNARRQPRLNKIIRLGQAGELVVKNQVGFRVEAQSKQIIPNMKAEQQNWARKKNTMSSNEIMRQQILLNNLCMVSKHVQEPLIDSHQENDIKSLSSVVQDKTVFKTDESESELNDQPEVIQDRNSLVSKKVNELPTPLQHKLVVPDQRQVFHLQQKREDIGINTASASSTTNSHADMTSPPMQSNQLLCGIANWGHEYVKIGQDNIDAGLVATSSDGARQIFIMPKKQNELAPMQCSTQFDTRVINQKTFAFPLSKPMTASASRGCGTSSKPMTAAASMSPRTRTSGKFAISIQDYCGAPSAAETNNNLFNSGKKSCHSSNVSQVMHTAAKRAVYHRKRQMKDVFNMGELQSQNLKGIKVSRLKDLGKKEPGNPHYKNSLIQQQLDEKAQLFKSGGEYTKELMSQHVQEKWHADVIQDFANHSSRFNSPQENKSSLISLQKLTGRHPKLEKVIAKPQTTEDDSISAMSRESCEQTFQVNMMRRIINETKNISSQVVLQNYQSSKKSLKFADMVIPNVQSENTLGNDTLLDDQSAKHRESSLLINQQLLSPHCSRIKLKPKELTSQKQIGLDDSVEMAKKQNRSRTSRRNGGNSGEERQNRTARGINKDMADMLYEDIDPVGVQSNSDEFDVPNHEQEQAEEFLVIDNEDGYSQGEQNMPNMDEVMGNNHSQPPQIHKLESSDNEDNLSRNLMNPMGIEGLTSSRVVENEYAEVIRISYDGSKSFEKKLVPKSKPSEKLQVYSVYELAGEEPNARKSIDQQRQIKLTDCEQIDSLATLKEDQTNQIMILQKEMSAPVVGVMAVKIQNLSFSQGPGEDSKRTFKGIRGTSLIKHVDQSLQPGKNLATRKSQQLGSSFSKTIISKRIDSVVFEDRPVQILFQTQRSTLKLINDKTRSSLALQCDILEQFNAVNSVLAPNYGNGYHQLDLKLYQSSLKNEKNEKNNVTPLSIQSSVQTIQPIPVPCSVKSPNYMNKFNGRREQTPQHKQDTNFEEQYEELGEIGYISHAALENHLHKNRMNKGLLELRKREQIKLGKAEVVTGKQTMLVDQSIVASEQQQHAASLISSQQFSLERDGNFNSLTNSATIQTPSAYLSRFKSSHDIESLQRNRYIDDNEFKEGTQKEFEQRQIRKVEKEITKCINIEKLLKTPVSEVYDALQDLVGSIPGNDNDDFQSTSEPELNKDQFIEEIPDDELHELLGQDFAGMKDTSRRYFLKFSGLQIVNVDCESGIINDIEPISLPMGLMVNLFFLSCDQLQHVLSQSLHLLKVENRLKLHLDEEVLREKMRKIVPRIIREDYFSAPLQVNTIQAISENASMIKDSFNLEIRLPRLEIVTKANEHHNHGEPLFKTALMHNLSGRQMMTIIHKYHLGEWASFAKKLIKKGMFGQGSSQQVEDDSSIIQFQRLLADGAGFVPYMDPIQLKQEEEEAQNLQLYLLKSSQEKFTMQIAFLRPVDVKLLLDQDHYEKRSPNDPYYQHLPGYLPESSPDKQRAAQMIASVQIPFIRLPFLKQVFGAKIEDSSDGSLLECLYDLVELHLDTKRDIMKLEIPSWRRLEDINIRQLSQKYFEDKLMAQKDILKYKSGGRDEEVKAMLHSSGVGHQPLVAGPLHSQDYTSIQQHSSDFNLQQQQPLSPATVSLNELVPKSAILSQVPKQQDPAQLPSKIKQRRFRINDMVCKLKIGSLAKVAYAQDFVYQNARFQSIKFYEAHQKVSLAEFFSV